MPITLPDLPYAYNALEPVISAATLRLHHGAHHGGYVNRLNALISGSGLEGASLEEIVRRSAGSAGVDSLIFNNAAQAWNHAFFWRSMRPKSDGPPSALAARFAEQMKSAAAGVFGSGWVWLVEKRGAVDVVTTANAGTPFALGLRPLLVLDVWEHAYYLDHQNRRDVYVAAVVDRLLDWEFAERNLAQPEAAHA